MQSFLLYYLLAGTLIILILFYILLGARLLYYKRYEGMYSKSPTLDTMKSGDIFLVAYGSLANMAFEGVMGINFEHTGVLVWDDDELYVVEYALYKGEYNGVIKVPFSTWLKMNKNSLIYYNSLETSDENREKLGRKILNFYENTKHKGSLGSFGPSWGRFIFPGVEYKFNEESVKNGDRNIVCTEYTTALVSECGVVEKNKSIESYYPQDFINMKGFDLKSGYEYDGYILNPIHLSLNM